MYYSPKQLLSRIHCVLFTKGQTVFHPTSSYIQSLGPTLRNPVQYFFFCSSNAMPSFDNLSITSKMCPASDLRTEIRRRLHSWKSPSGTPEGGSKHATDEKLRSSISSTNRAADPRSLHLSKEELEMLQAKCYDMQTELDNYKQRVLELEELCRDMQVTYMMSSLEVNESRGGRGSSCQRCRDRSRRKSGEEQAK
ncbi:hypothetical protein BJX64DRAFT_152440 [Aspergillus heterothallicus]